MADLDPDTLASKIAGLLRGSKAAKGDDDDDDTGSSARIPKERLDRERQKVKDLTARLAEIEGHVAELTNATKAALAAKDAEFVTQAQRLAATHAEDLKLVDLGFSDPLGRQALRQVWEGTPKAARGESPAELWQTLTAAQQAHLADPKANPNAPAIPKVLTPYLPAPQVAEQPQGKQQINGRQAPPRVDAGTTKAQRGVADIDATKTSPADFLAMLSRG